MAARLEQPESSPDLRAQCGRGLAKAPEADPETALGGALHLRVRVE